MHVVFLRQVDAIDTIDGGPDGSYGVLHPCVFVFGRRACENEICIPRVVYRHEPCAYTGDISRDVFAGPGDHEPVHASGLRPSDLNNLEWPPLVYLVI